jgi:predicted HTH domain antitoxin
MTEYVTTNIRLPKETYRELKQRALDAEISLAEVVRESVAQYLVAPATLPGAHVVTDRAASQAITRMNAAWVQESGAVTIAEGVLSSAHITAAELLLELALLLFQQRKLTLGQASRLAGMGQMQFQHLLASRQIPVHYHIADFEADLRTLGEMGQP